LWQGARQAKLAPLCELCEAVWQVYGAVAEQRLAADEQFFTEMLAAHEALTGMLDQVAAARRVAPRPERISALRGLLARPVALGEPEAAFDGGALPEELLESDALELESFAEEQPVEELRVDALPVEESPRPVSTPMSVLEPDE